jgi:uncharacterized protein (DUF362 family)
MVSIVKGEDPEAMVSEAINLLGGIDRFVRRDDVVFIKPNVCGGVAGKRGSYTDPKVISTLIKLTKDRASRVIVGEADSEMYRAETMLKETGIRRTTESLGAEVVNLSNGEMVTIDLPDAYILKELKISKAIADADVIVSAPVAKTHLLTDVTLSLKCMYGALPLKNKAKYHKSGLNMVIADIVKAFPPHLSVVDATVGMEGEGPFRGKPIDLNLIICGDNAVATDSVAVSILGYEPSKIKHLELAARNGIGPLNLEEIEIKGEKVVKRKFKKAPGMGFVGKLTDTFESLIPEKIFSNIFHKYYEFSVEGWQKKKK